MKRPSEETMLPLPRKHWVSSFVVPFSVRVIKAESSTVAAAALSGSNWARAGATRDPETATMRVNTHRTRFTRCMVRLYLIVRDLIYQSQPAVVSARLACFGLSGQDCISQSAHRY